MDKWIRVIKLSEYAWYRKLIGGIWKQYCWYDWRGFPNIEWRKVHNGKWCEFELISKTH